jgi:cyanophycinase
MRFLFMPWAQRAASALALLMSLNAPSLAASAAPPVKGVAIVVGGALKNDNEAVWQRIVDEAGGAGARIAVFATAANNPERSGGQIVAALNKRGAKAQFIPVAPKLKTADLAKNLNDPELIAQVAASGGVFFSGGAQELIVDTLQPKGEATAMLKAIRGVFERGGVVAGTSAGAAVMSRMMFRDAQDNMEILKGRWREGREFDRGLGFVGPDLFVDQHFLKRGRIGRILPAMRALGYTRGLGVEENSAIVVRGAEVEVIGGRGALLVDLSEATSDPKLRAFNLRGVQLSYLDRGDRHNIATGVSTPAEHKLREPRIDPAAPDYKPYLETDPYYLDILGDSTILSAMVTVLDSPRAEIRGLAYRAKPLAGDAAPEIGFEFRLYKGPGLVGWYSGALGGDDYTVLKVRLDVLPVRMAQPLFTPLTPEAEPVRR